MAIERVEEKRQRIQEMEDQEKKRKELQDQRLQELESKKDMRAEDYQKTQERKNNIDLLA